MIKTLEKRIVDSEKRIVDSARRLERIAELVKCKSDILAYLNFAKNRDCNIEQRISALEVAVEIVMLNCNCNRNCSA